MSIKLCKLLGAFYSISLLSLLLSCLVRKSISRNASKIWLIFQKLTYYLTYNGSNSARLRTVDNRFLNLEPTEQRTKHSHSSIWGDTSTKLREPIRAPSHDLLIWLGFAQLLGVQISLDLQQKGFILSKPSLTNFPPFGCHPKEIRSRKRTEQRKN